jgi:hypothetical protein
MGIRWLSDLAGTLRDFTVKGFLWVTGKYMTATGPNTYSATPAVALGAYFAGLEITVVFVSANTGAATLDVGGCGPVALQINNAALTAGQIVAGGTYVLVYDGANFQVIGSSLKSPLTTKGDLWGFGTTNARVTVGADTTYLGADSSSASGLSYSNPLDVLPTKQHALHYATSAVPGNVYNNGMSGVGATLTASANGLLTINGVLPNSGDMAIIAGETTSANNGLYVVTSFGSPVAKYVLTRSSQMNSPAQFYGACIFFPGTGNGSSAGNVVRCTSKVTTVGTTAGTFAAMRFAVPNADLVTGATNTVKGNIGSGTADLAVSDLQTMLSLSGTNSGDVTLAAFGSTPNANGASLSGQALSMQPADGTHPGGVSTAAQTFGGAKTFAANIIPQTYVQYLTGVSFPGVLGSNGTGYDYADASLGRVTFGRGSTYDILLGDRNGNTVLGMNSVSGIAETSKDFAVTTAGKGFRVKEGTNCKQGTATLVAGTVTVSNTSVTAASKIFTQGAALNSSTAIGQLDVTAQVAGTSFTITSLSATKTTVTGDLRTVNYQIFEQG